jgi:hypothetical protein
MRIKILLLLIGLVFIAIQFIRPVRNQNGQVWFTDLANSVIIPDTVQAILRNACYDCHSNYTQYPWYASVQPIGWLLADHIKQAREELNFSEFGNYSHRKQISKLDGIANSIGEDIMPLTSYKLMHKNARLSEVEKSLIIGWAQKTGDNLGKEENSNK